MIPSVAECNAWAARQRVAGSIIVVADLTVYEVRRELLRVKATAKLLRLDRVISNTRDVRVTLEAWLKAAEFWAVVRSAGLPTADPHALDGDAILAGVAATIGSPGDLVTIATSNVGHLARFPGVDAQRWEGMA